MAHPGLSLVRRLMADAVEAAGQHVNEEATDERGGRERHRLEAVTPAAAVVAAEITEPSSEVLTQSRPVASGRSGLIEISLGGGRRVRVDSNVGAAVLARVLEGGDWELGSADAVG